MISPTRDAASSGVQHVQHALGTTFTVDVRDGAAAGVDLIWAVHGALDALHDADRRLSPRRSCSIVSQFRSGARSLEQCPADMVSLVLRCAELHERTDGWFDPWAMAGGFNPSAFIRGWAATQALRELGRRGARHARVDAGGDVAVMGSADGTDDGTEDGPGWLIEVDDPFRPGRLLAAVRGSDLGVASSGPFQTDLQAVARPGTVGPRRSAPAVGVAAIVVARDLAVASACSTAAAAQGPQALRWLDRDPLLTAMLITANGQSLRTGNWPDAWAGPC